MNRTDTRDRTRFTAELGARIDRLPYSGLPLIQFAIVGVAYFFVFYDLSVVGFTLPQLTKDLSLTGGEAASVVTLYLLSYVVGAVILARYSEKVGRRKAMLITVVVVAVGGLMSGLAWDFWSLTAFRIITGAGTGAEIALASTIVAETSPSRKRGKYLQYMYFWGAAGLTIAPFTTVGLLNFTYGWRIALALGGLVALVMIVMRNKYLDESPRWLALRGHVDEAESIVAKMEARNEKKIGGPLPPVAPVAPDPEHEGKVFALFLRKPYLSRTIITLVYWILWIVPADAYLSYAPTVLATVEQHASFASVLTAIGYLGTPIGAVVAFFVVDLGQRKYLLALFALIFAAGLSLIALSPTNGIAVVGALACSAMIAATSVAYSYMAEIYPTAMRATGFGLVDSGGNVGGAFAPIVVVALLGFVGGTGVLWVLAALVAASAIVILVGGVKTTGKHLTDISDK